MIPALTQKIRIQLPCNSGQLIVCYLQLPCDTTLVAYDGVGRIQSSAALRSAVLRSAVLRSAVLRSAVFVRLLRVSAVYACFHNLWALLLA